MKQVTICFFIQGDQVLLAMKKRGFGQGKWNGYGGKIEGGESIEQAAVREVQEESGIAIPISALRKTAEFTFSFESNPAWDEQAYVFFIDQWSGQARETEEMAPRWFSINDLPYDEMWIADREWLPMILSGKTVRGAVRFSSDGSQIVSASYHDVVW